MPYKDLFFDLDHTIWDFELNSKETLWDLHQKYALEAKGINNFDEFYNIYSVHNHRLWDRYSKGFIKQEELRMFRPGDRWKRGKQQLSDLYGLAQVNFFTIFTRKINLLCFAKETIVLIIFSFPFFGLLLRFSKSEQSAMEGQGYVHSYPSSDPVHFDYTKVDIYLS